MGCTKLMGLAGIAVLASASAVAWAGQDLIIPLKFIPTTGPTKVTAQLRDGISNKPVAVEDARQVKSIDLVGEGTGAGDDTFRIRYAGHLPSYLKTTVQDRLGAWGVQVDDKANLVLILKATRFHVTETHEFYGSIFTAEVQLPWTLADRSGQVFASGAANGTGKTKGRWRNAVNCEEVLADALQQAAAAVVSDAVIQEAWLAAVPQPAPAPAPVAKTLPPSQPQPAHAAAKTPVAGSAKTPNQLLTDVKKLYGEKLGNGLIADYISKQTLTAAFSTNDLIAWKKAGIPENLMTEAVRRAP
jgi:hypothetical protein